MSHSNAEVIERIWELFGERVEQGDAPLDATFALFDEGLVAAESRFTPVREVPGWKTYVGAEGLAEFFRAWTGEWDEWTARLEEILDDADDRVLAVVHQSARGRGSGVVVENRFWIVYTLAGGQVTDQMHYLDPADALEAFRRPRS